MACIGRCRCRTGAGREHLYRAVFSQNLYVWLPQNPRNSNMEAAERHPTCDGSRQSADSQKIWRGERKRYNIYPFASLTQAENGTKPNCAKIWLSVVGFVDASVK